MKNIAIFASGSGTNAQKIIEHFNQSSNKTAKVALVLCNKENAGVLTVARAANVPFVVVSKTQLNDETFMLNLLHEHKVDFIVLAGFLLLVPAFLTAHFNQKIINIHPALLPKYGGKGMYGKFVHEAVWQNRESQTGITIHYASEHYDEGDIIFQAPVALLPEDTPTTIAQKVQQLEHFHYPLVIENLLSAK
jgi:phosphoribosylglycinamide formyltransferase-1